MKRRSKSNVLLDADTIDAVCVAEMGQDNDVVRKESGICARTGAPLTDGQISYRLTQAKKIAGFKKGDGFRRAWREGRSRYALMARRAVMSVAREDYQTQIANQVAKPGLRVVSQSRFERRERAKADRYERTGRLSRAA